MSCVGWGVGGGGEKEVFPMTKQNRRRFTHHPNANPTEIEIVEALLNLTMLSKRVDIVVELLTNLVRAHCHCDERVRVPLVN